MKKTLFLSLMFLLTLGASAQKSNEIGLFLGGSYYTGELNPGGHLNTFTRPAAGVVFRHNFNMRLAMAANAFFGSVEGIDARSSSFQTQQRNLSFRSRMYELGARFEFNFLEYRIGNDKYDFTPFMFLGIAAFNMNPRASIGGDWVALQPLKTEGQSKGYLRTQVSIPFGAGFRLNLAKRIGLVADWGLRKTFTDYIDDVSTVYASPAVLGSPIAIALADRSLNADNVSNVGKQRGNPRAKDWYSFIGLTLTFQLNDKPVKCAGYDY
jgi:hypothetical protein